jgi:hypothetical protein
MSVIRLTPGMFHDLQPFADHGEVDEGEACDIPTWTGQVGHEALSYRIIHDREHDRNAAGCLFECG